MKNRAEIYAKEASELLNIITMYKLVTAQQASAFFIGKEDKINNLLNYLQKQGRIFYDSQDNTYSAQREKEFDYAMQKALWLLIDFYPKIEYHSPGDFPAKIIFMTAEQIYEIIYIEPGKEILQNNIFRQQNDPNPPNRLLIIEDLAQTELIDIPGLTAFCLIDDEGKVEYYNNRSD